jgi:hypothetical protein
MGAVTPWLRQQSIKACGKIIPHAFNLDWMVCLQIRSDMKTDSKIKKKELQGKPSEL